MLNVIEQDGFKKASGGYKIAMWKCICDCQLNMPEDQRNYVKVSGIDLRSGHVKSCGCLKYKSSTKTHGLSHTPFYNVWVMMRQRCNNLNNKDYKHYGARGIKVCERWNSFDNFFDDMHGGYKPGLELDRIDNSGDYCKENCRWTDRSGNMRNTRRNHIIHSEWGDICLQEFCEKVSEISDKTPEQIRGMADYGYSIERIYDLCEIKGGEDNGIQKTAS